MRQWVFRVAAIIFGLSASCSLLPADDGNYQNYIVGERAAGMGGAAAACASSVDACYFNPAGLVDTPGSTISLSASLYGFYRYHVDNGWSVGEDMNLSSFVTIPSTFGSVWKVSDEWALSLSAFVPDRTSVNNLEVFDLRHFYKYSKDDQSLWIGPTASYRLTPDLSVGVSAFGVYRTFSWFRDICWAGVGNFSEDIRYNDLSLLALMGGMYRIDGHWSTGLTLQTPTLHLTGSGEYLRKEDAFVSYMEDATTRNGIPTKITAGVAYQERQKYAVACDLSYYFPASFNQLEGDNQFGNFTYYPLKRDGTFNVNLGGEYYVKERYPVRMGFFTNLSTVPGYDPENNYLNETRSYPEKVDMYGITASVGRETEHTTLSMGVDYVWGSGKYLGSDENGGLTEVNASKSYLYVFLASSYIF